MGCLTLRSSLVASVLVLLVLGNGPEPARAQQAAQADDPIAPTPAAPVIPVPEVGPNPVDAAAQPGAAGPTNQNILAPPTPTNRPPARTSPVSTSRNNNRNNSSFSPRLARAAPIMGDSVAPSLVFQDELGSGTRELPQGGGATRSKIAENSSSLPMDRWIFNYNHFHNAIDENLMQSTNIDRFTVGIEKTFLDQMASIELRFPFVLDNDFVLPGDFIRNGSDAGNLAITLKGVLTSDQDSLIAAGVTIDTPTGGGTVLTNLAFIDPLTVEISNDALHVSPFVGFLCAPGNGNTHQGFIQVDVPTTANDIVFTDSSGMTVTDVFEQTLLYIDYQFARELYSTGRGRRSGNGIRRILGLAEVHYTTTLEDADVVLSGTVSNPVFEVTSAGNRLDVVNITLGIHTVLNGGAQIRLGTVAPITNDDDRFFDFEFQAQMNVPLR